METIDEALELLKTRDMKEEIDTDEYGWFCCTCGKEEHLCVCKE